jgi:adenosylhomocysteine nucleosidase
MRLSLVLVTACATAGPRPATTGDPLVRVVVMISANTEWKAVVPHLGGAAVHDAPYGQWTGYRFGGEDVVFFHGGYGKVSAAGSTQYAIDTWHPRLLLVLGTCGGFGDAKVGDVVLATKTIIYDIIEQQGDPDEALGAYTTTLDTSAWPARLAAKVKPQLVMSADRDIVVAEVPKLRDHFHASVADWESGAIAWVAARTKTRVMLLKVVTDLVDAHGDSTYGNIDAWTEITNKTMADLLVLAADALPDLLAK